MLSIFYTAVVAMITLHVFDASAQSFTRDPNSVYSAVNTVTASTFPPITTPTSTATQMFHFESTPAVLDASVISRHWEADIVSSIQEVVSYQVDCPASSSPENDACRSLGIYPAIVAHTKPSVYGGTITATAQQATTTWSCSIGGSINYEGDSAVLAATCDETVVSGGSTVTSTASLLNNCEVLRHYAPLNITAGLEKLQLDYPQRLQQNLTISDYQASITSQLAAGRCLAVQTLDPDATTQATADVTTTSGSASSTNGSITTSDGSGFDQNRKSWHVAGLGFLAACSVYML